MDATTNFQILDEVVYISLSANALGKGMHPTILPLAMSKQSGRLASLTFLWQAVEQKENFRFKPFVTQVKKLTSYHILPILDGLGI